MKKSLFSLAFLAASGGYVVFANHGFDGALPPVARPEEAAIGPATDPSSMSPAVLQQPAPAATVKPSAAIVALAIPTAPTRVPVVVTPTPAPVVVAPTPAVPPLPRPRPTNAPTIQPAQATTTAQLTTGQYRNGTYTGGDENAYYGHVQVQVTVAGNQIASVKVLDYPSDRRTSRYINSQALPMLQQEVMQAQSANVDTVSGATLTSDAYIKSLGTALSQAAASGNA
jgi:uncharacterized protein with FMN-binding domain